MTSCANSNNTLCCHCHRNHMLLANHGIAHYYADLCHFVFTVPPGTLPCRPQLARSQGPQVDTALRPRTGDIGDTGLAEGPWGLGH